jgi:hypothetical protein
MFLELGYASGRTDYLPLDVLVVHDTRLIFKADPDQVLTSVCPLGGVTRTEALTLEPSPIGTSVCPLSGVTQTEGPTAAVKYEVSLLD